MTADSYARSGGVREAIRLTAERAFDELSPDDQQAARKLFLRLVTPGKARRTPAPVRQCLTSRSCARSWINLPVRIHGFDLVTRIGPRRAADGGGRP